MGEKSFVATFVAIKYTDIIIWFLGAVILIGILGFIVYKKKHK